MSGSIGNGEFMERAAATKTACPSDRTPYDFPTVTVAGGMRGCARQPANVGS